MNERDICTECMEGYFLNKESKCERNPDPRIENCGLYATLSVCGECLNKFKLINNECLPFEDPLVLDNCEKTKFDGEEECYQCDSNYYSDDGICVSRTSVSNCAMNDRTKDRCLACTDG